jgi:hypothetical protein
LQRLGVHILIVLQNLADGIVRFGCCGPFQRGYFNFTNGGDLYFAEKGHFYFASTQPENLLYESTQA